MDYHEGTHECIDTPRTSSLHSELSCKQEKSFVRTHASYFVGGALSSSFRWALTPIDNIKCKMQVNPARYTSFRTGLLLTWQESGLAGLYRGFLPTALAYSSQTGTKYMMYEFLKEASRNQLGNEEYYANRNLIYLVSAASAEAIADVAMAPWEMIKIKVQTSTNFPNRLAPALATMIGDRHALGFPFGILRPLWTRQIVGTVANFYTFENVAEYIYDNVLVQDKETYTKSTQLAVTVASGAVAGVASATLSHPFDTLVSLKTKNPEQTLYEIAKEYGWRNLLTRGLAPRVLSTGSILCVQWFLYDSFKTLLGMKTTGGSNNQ